MSTAGRAPRTLLPLARNPLRLAVSASVWQSAWFLIVYLFFAGWVMFAVAFTAATTAVTFAVTIAGIPLLTAASATLRGCAAAERLRLRSVLTEPVTARYQSTAGRGLLGSAAVRWRDAATWRDLAYLIGLWPFLFALDLAVLTVWLVFLAGVAAPAYYWAVPGTNPVGYSGTRVHGIALGYFPNGAHGPGGWGFYADTLPKALLLAAACLILFLLFNYVLAATARAHARIAASLLGAPADPLAAAKDVLAHPGPLPPLPTG